MQEDQRVLRNGILIKGMKLNTQRNILNVIRMTAVTRGQRNAQSVQQKRKSTFVLKQQQNIQKMLYGIGL